MFKRFSFFILLLISLVAALSAHATQLAAIAAVAPHTILVFGDSLSAGYGIAVSESWPALLGERLKQDRKPYVVLNASISGETTAGGNARFAAALEQAHPAIVILALGANDGLRGLPVSAMQDNLAMMIKMTKQHQARVLLVGMRLPPNYGSDYTQHFEAVFRRLAKREKISLIPFLLEPIATDSQAFQADGLHPTAKAQPKILDHIWKPLLPLLELTPAKKS
ncbi:MAG: arylesterase [Rugosibacter sp.]|nr:MAG: arylesterase [Rugosibacter sp.]TBR08417.1 MAG: arylesterase [Rugosibacter sp.]